MFVDCWSGGWWVGGLDARFGKFCFSENVGAPSFFMFICLHSSVGCPRYKTLQVSTKLRTTITWLDRDSETVTKDS